MDAYSIFKLLHILSAMAWLGGGLTLIAQSVFAIRDKGELETIRGLGELVAMGKRWFVPAALLTLVFGLAMTFVANLWGELWILLGLAGFATSFVVGAFVCEPKAKAMARFLDEGRQAEALEQGRSVLRIAKFDYAMMTLIVADMVLKPRWTDLALLGTFAAILAAAAWFFLHAPAKPEPVQPAE